MDDTDRFTRFPFKPEPSAMTAVLVHELSWQLEPVFRLPKPCDHRIAGLKTCRWCCSFDGLERDALKHERIRVPLPRTVVHHLLVCIGIAPPRLTEFRDYVLSRRLAESEPSKINRTARLRDLDCENGRAQNYSNRQ
jgi:hypothetical protein